MSFRSICRLKAGGAEASGTVKNERVAGLIIGLNDPVNVDNFKLSVAANLGGKNIELLSSMPGRALFEAGGIEHGQSEADVEFAEQVAHKGDAANAPPNLRTVVAVKIPLGSIVLTESDRLDVKIEAVNNGGTLPGGASILIGWFAGPLKPGERIVKWFIHDADPNVALADCRAAFIFRRDAVSGGNPANEASGLDGTKIQAAVKTGDSESTMDGDFLYFGTLAVTRCAMGPRATALLFEDFDEARPPETVGLVLTGTDVGSWAIVSQTYVGDDEDRAEQAAAHIATTVAAKLDKLPAPKRRAMEKAGRIPNVAKFQQAAKVMRATVEAKHK